MNRIIGAIATLILVLSALGFTHRDRVSIMGLKFVAPTVNGKDNVYDPEAGEIIYDSLASKFFGYTQAGTWTDLSAGGGGLAVPPGVILPFGGIASASPPDGYKFADGSELSRTEYAALFAVIGSSFGPGDGVNTFNLPDMRGMFMRGVDGTANRDPEKNIRGTLNSGTSGNAVGSYQADAIQNILGSISHVAHDNASVVTGTGAFAYVGTSGSTGNGSGSGPSDVVSFDASRVVRTAPETRVKNIYVNYIVKY